MRILFEEYHYTPEDLSGVLNERFHSPVSKTNRLRKINYVGYYFNPKTNDGNGDIVLIFPKVFLNKEAKAFGLFNPNEIIDSSSDLLKGLKSDEFSPNLIYEMATWLYRAIDKYRRNCENEKISELSNLNPVLSKNDVRSSTELEVIEALREFYNENKDLFTFITKKSNSQKHKINWSRTIATKTPVIVKNDPIYFDVHSKRKKIDYDEELIQIFFSVLNSLKVKYGFEFKLNINYNLIKGARYGKLERSGYRYLKSIKYRYFNDKMIRLHELLSLYFERVSNSNSRKPKEEYLLIKDFNQVFENMIDKLIGDEMAGDIKELKNQPDKKLLDHIYKEKGILQKDPIYSVADSKYYMEKSDVDRYSIYKQFTYARNILALSLDFFDEYREEKRDKTVRYQDEVYTEGYHPTPNFFVSGFFDAKRKNSEAGLEKNLRNGEFVHRSAHWDNRLFDRDTLFTLSYSINFMFVLMNYVRKNNSVNQKFKKDTRLKFREEFIDYLDTIFEFYIILPKREMKSTLDNHFRNLIGVSFCPNPKENKLMLALEKDKLHRGNTTQEVIKELSGEWLVETTTLEKYEESQR